MLMDGVSLKKKKIMRLNSKKELANDTTHDPP
jgi:hypothetical protein